jgi:hypothetical protein
MLWSDRRKPMVCRLALVLLAAGMLQSTASLACEDHATPESRIQCDFQLNSQHSRYNFTDIKRPYDAIDSYAVAKVAIWLDQARQFAPYVELVGSHTTEPKFWFQKNIQAALGLQWYPFPLTGSQALRAVRFYALVAGRDYPSQPNGATIEKSDRQVGADYYYDNILEPVPKERTALGTITAFANLSHRKTNFSLPDYDAVTFFGNVRVGPKFDGGCGGFVFPHLLVDWNNTPAHDNRWWENYVRAGAGVRWYPFASSGAGCESSSARKVARRFTVFAEALKQVAYPGDRPPGIVKDVDYRIGISFSTDGFTRQ